MDSLPNILKELKKCKYKVSTDTRKDVSGTAYFAIKGENFDGNKFVNEALKKGATFAVSDEIKNVGKNVFIVENVLKTLQESAKYYRKTFKIPIIVIGGSNGKTTSKDLLVEVLKTKYKVHSTIGSLNNHLGVPLAILSMDRKTQIGVFEIGANHPSEHLQLLDIIQPTHVAVTNNGMDHLEGFGSPAGARKANKEIYDWAKKYKAKVFVNKNHKDLIKDSSGNKCIKYPANKIEFKSQLVGNYNLENLELAFAIGKYFKVNKNNSLEAISNYVPLSKRSELKKINGIDFVVDCYNANPTSMKLSLQSFIKSAKHPKGVILGDMLELGKYSETEHKKIVDFVSKQKLDLTVFIGKNFKKVLKNVNFKYKWFPDSESAKKWFAKQKFTGFTFLLKGSRGIAVEKILDL